MRTDEIADPTPCSYYWGKIKLTSGLLDKASPIDLQQSTSLEEALAFFTKEKSLVAQIQSAQKISLEAPQGFSFEDYFKSLGYSRFDLLIKIKDLLDQLPQDFLNWSSEKKLQARDFDTFLKDYTKDQHFEDFKKIASLQASKSLGLQIIDLYFDLLAQNKIDSSLLQEFTRAESLFKKLKHLQFSKSLQKDEELKAKISKISLQKNIKLQVQRQGDLRLLKLEVSASSPDSLLQSLLVTQDKITDIKKDWES